MTRITYFFDFLNFSFMIFRRLLTEGLFCRSTRLTGLKLSGVAHRPSQRGNTPEHPPPPLLHSLKFQTPGYSGTGHVSLGQGVKCRKQWFGNLAMLCCEIVQGSLGDTAEIAEGSYQVTF